MLTRIILVIFLAFTVSTVHAQYTPADAKLPINIYAGRRLLYESPDGPLPKYMEYLISSNDGRLPELLLFIRDHISNLTVANVLIANCVWGNSLSFTTSFWCYTRSCVTSFAENKLTGNGFQGKPDKRLAKYIRDRLLFAAEYNETSNRSGTLEYAISRDDEKFKIILMYISNAVGSLTSIAPDPHAVSYILSYPNYYALNFLCQHAGCVQKFRDAGLA